MNCNVISVAKQPTGKMLTKRCKGILTQRRKTGGDSELREQILTEQTNRTNADDILNGEKADKTDLYGKETDVVHTITHSLEKSDLSIDINTSYGDGTITINSLAVQTKMQRYKQSRFQLLFLRKRAKKAKSGLICSMTNIQVNSDWKLQSNQRREMLQR